MSTTVNITGYTTIIHHPGNSPEEGSIYPNSENIFSKVCF